MDKQHIVIIDDDKEICSLLQDFLVKHDYHITALTNENDLFTILDDSNAVDLIILDLMLPNTNGFEICKQLRANFNRIPIIMLTALTDDIDKILGLEIGADDYLTKPFNPRELLARIKAILRRTEEPLETKPTNNNNQPISNINRNILKFGGWKLNTASRQLFSPNDVEVSLSSRSYDLLLVFLERPQHVLSRDQLLTILSNRTAEPFDRSIDVQVSRLRQKLEDDSKEPRLIKTVRNGGYLFALQVEKTYIPNR